MFTTQKGNYLPLLGIFVLLLVGGGVYYLLPQLNKEVVIDKGPVVVPTLIPEPTSSATSTGSTTETDVIRGDWTIKFVQKKPEDFIQDIHLVNPKTNTDKIIGQNYVVSPGAHAIFSKDQSIVIFLEAKDEVEDSKLDDARLDREGVSFYSIPQTKVVKSISLRDIKKALPDLLIPRNAGLNSLLLSPNDKKIAMSYGYTYELDSGSDIIIIDLSSYKISTVKANGVVKAWKDDMTLQYEITESRDNDQYIHTATKEVAVN